MYRVLRDTSMRTRTRMPMNVLEIKPDLETAVGDKSELRKSERHREIDLSSKNLIPHWTDVIRHFSGSINP